MTHNDPSTCTQTKFFSETKRLEELVISQRSLFVSHRRFDQIEEKMPSRPFFRVSPIVRESDGGESGQAVDHLGFR